MLLVEGAFPSQVIVGQNFGYDVKVTNLTSQALNNVVVYDSFPATLRVVSSEPTAQPGTNNSVMWNLGTLGARETKTVKMTGTATNPGTISTCMSATYSIGLCCSIEAVQASLRLAKVAPAEVSICDNIPVKVTVTNSGQATLRNVRVSDTLPAGLKGTDGRTSMDFDAGTLNAGASKEFTFNVKADKAGSYTNTALASAEGGVKSEQATTTTRVLPPPVLAMKAECPGSIMIGREATAKFTVTNNGETASANTVISAAVPTGTTFSSADSGGAVSAGKVQWNVGTLAPKASKTVTMVVRSMSAGTIQASATATGTCATAVNADCNYPVQGVPDIGTLLTDDDGVVLVGDNHVFRYEVKNQGQTNLTNITVVCELSDGLDFVSSTAAVQPKIDGRKLTFENVHAVLKPGEIKNFTLTCKGTKPGEQFVQSTTSCAELKRSNRNDEQVNYVPR